MPTFCHKFKYRDHWLVLFQAGGRSNILVKQRQAIEVILIISLYLYYLNEINTHFCSCILFFIRLCVVNIYAHFYVQNVISLLFKFI